MIMIIVTVVGLCAGSFVNALVWRLHQQQKKGRASPKDTKRLSILKGRSMCPDCHHELAWQDLLPVVSWLLLGGKCRYCHRSISWQYPAVELATAGLFVLSFVLWTSLQQPEHILTFVSWLLILTGLIALLVYDARWLLLPNKIMYPLMLIAFATVLLQGVAFGNYQHIISSIWGALIGGGLFYFLFLVSGGRWIGGGDPKLGALLGLVLGSPGKSVALIFGASLLGTLVALPFMLTRRLKVTSKIPLGPFLIVTAIVLQLVGTSLVSWYSKEILHLQ